MFELHQEVSGSGKQLDFTVLIQSEASEFLFLLHCNGRPQRLKSLSRKTILTREEKARKRSLASELSGS